MVYLDTEGLKIEYKAFKAVFKFPAEHVINEEPHFGELQSIIFDIFLKN